jgi:hypothetical protein
MCNCRNYLQVTSLAGGATFNITAANQPLNDGQVYSMRLNQTFPALTGMERVVVTINATTVYLVDRRAREVLSERMLRYGERIRMVYSENSVNGLPAFLVFEGIQPIY